MAGGIGLIVSGVLDVVWIGLLGTPDVIWVKVVGDCAYAASVLLLMIGLSLEASVVARAPSGIAAAAILVTWPLIDWLASAAFTSASDGLAAPGGYILVLVPACAALIAVVRIARARVVPSPWRWAPAWVLAGQSLLWLAPQVALVAGTEGASPSTGLLSALGLISLLAGTVGLGVVSVYLAAAQRADTTQVYRSS